MSSQKQVSSLNNNTKSLRTMFEQLSANSTVSPPITRVRGTSVHSKPEDSPATKTTSPNGVKNGNNQNLNTSQNGKTTIRPSNAQPPTKQTLNPTLSRPQNPPSKDTKQKDTPTPTKKETPTPPTKQVTPTPPTKQVTQTKAQEAKRPPSPLDDSDDEVTLRVGPLIKPKPDARKSGKHIKIVVPPPETSPTQTTQSTPDKQEPPKTNLMKSGSDFEIHEKWKINFDEIELADLVSAGSAGEVYLGYYFGTAVAVKKLFAIAPDQKHLVAREFSMLQGVNHPNIVQFLGICDHESGVYLITEYVEHGDLFDLLIFGEEDIGWKAKVKIAMQVATAVYYLHSRNIIHRDLKSQNILIGDNRVKLCDLGLATILENKKRMTVCGTDEWMAPEIVAAETYDNKVDVFSFGIVLTEMITNQPPKKRGFEDRFAFNVPKFLISVPTDCPQEFSQLAIDCTKYNPTERPSFKDLVQRLKKLQDSLPD